VLHNGDVSYPPFQSKCASSTVRGLDVHGVHQLRRIDRDLPKGVAKLDIFSD